MSITASQVYRLNRMNKIAGDCQLGTLLQDAETNPAEITLAEGSVLVGLGTGNAGAISAKGNAKILIGNGTTVTSASVSGDITVTNAGVVAIGAGKVLETMLAVPATAGLNVKRVAKAVFDPSGVVGQRTVGAHVLGVTLPINAIITRSYYFTKTQLTGGAGATVAIHAEAANDIFTATDILAEGAASIHEGVSSGTVATMKRCTAAREITATVAVDALTAGKLDIFVEYVVAE